MSLGYLLPTPSLQRRRVTLQVMGPRDGWSV